MASIAATDRPVGGSPEAEITNIACGRDKLYKCVCHLRREIFLRLLQQMFSVGKTICACLCVIYVDKYS